MGRNNLSISYKLYHCFSKYVYMWALNWTWAYILPHFILVVRVRVSAAWKDMETIWQFETLLPFHSSLYNRSASWRWFSFRRQSFKAFNNAFFCFYSILIKCGLSKKAVTDCYNLQLHTSFPKVNQIFSLLLKYLLGYYPLYPFHITTTTKKLRFIIEL